MPPLTEIGRWYRHLLSWGSLVVAAGIVVYLVAGILGDPNYQPKLREKTDFWAHLDIVNQTRLQFFEDGGGEEASRHNIHRKIPYYFGLAGLSSLTGLSPYRTMELAGVFNLALLCTGIVLFASLWGGARMPAGLFLVTAFCFWGKGFLHSNEIQVSQLIAGASYPSTFTFGLSLVALWFLVRLRRMRLDSLGLRLLVVSVLALLAAMVCLNHPVTFFMFLLPMAPVCIFFFRVKFTRLRQTVLFCVLLFICLAYAWPYGSYSRGRLYEYMFLIPSSDSEYPRQYMPRAHERHYTFEEVYDRAPAIFLGLPLAVWVLLFRRSRSSRGLAYLFLVFLNLYAISGFLLYWTMGYRWLYFAGFILQILTAKTIWECAMRPRTMLLSLLVAYAVFKTGDESIDKAYDLYREDAGYTMPLGEMEDIRSRVGDDIVLSGDGTSYYLTALGFHTVWRGKSVSIYQLSSDLEAWLDKPDEKSLNAVLERRRPQWVLFDKTADWNPSLPPAVDWKLELETDFYRLYGKR